MSADAPAASAAAAAATATTVADFPAFRDAQSGTMGPAPDARIISKFPEGVDLSNIRKIMAAAAQLKKSVIADVDPFWGRLAQFTPDTDIEAFTESLIDNYHSTFTFAIDSFILPLFDILNGERSNCLSSVLAVLFLLCSGFCGRVDLLARFSGPDDVRRLAHHC